MNPQEKVQEFMNENGFGGSKEYAILDLASEVGEIAADATKSAEWGREPQNLEVKEDELGDVMFSLLALANELDMDAFKALNTAMEKYERRIEETGDPSSRSIS